MANQQNKYEYKVTPNAADTKIMRMVGANKRVLELGSGRCSLFKVPGILARTRDRQSNQSK